MKSVSAIVLAVSLAVAPGCASDSYYAGDGPDAGELLIGALVVAAIVGVAIAADDHRDHHHHHHKRYHDHCDD